MFSFPFTMREEIARLRSMGSGHHTSTTRQPFGPLSLWHVLPPAPLAHLEICARPSSSGCKGRAEKSCVVMKAKHSTPCPTTGRYRKTDQEVSHCGSAQRTPPWQMRSVGSCRETDRLGKVDEDRRIRGVANRAHFAGATLKTRSSAFCSPR
jgi:hypothetical protein